MGRTIPGPQYGGEQFENLKPEVEATAFLAPTDDIEGARQALSGIVEAMLVDTTNEMIAFRRKPKEQARTRPPVQVTPANINPNQPRPAVQPLPFVNQAVPPPPVVGIPKVDDITW